MWKWTMRSMQNRHWSRSTMDWARFEAGKIVSPKKKLSNGRRYCYLHVEWMNSSIDNGFISSSARSSYCQTNIHTSSSTWIEFHRLQFNFGHLEENALFHISHRTLPFGLSVRNARGKKNTNTRAHEQDEKLFMKMSVWRREWTKCVWFVTCLEVFMHINSHIGTSFDSHTHTDYRWFRIFAAAYILFWFFFRLFSLACVKSARVLQQKTYKSHHFNSLHCCGDDSCWLIFRFFLFIIHIHSLKNGPNSSHSKPESDKRARGPKKRYFKMGFSRFHPVM